jgi:hypothetical protein
MPDPKTPVGTVRLSNAGPDDLRIWLEPWVDEFFVKPYGELALHVSTTAKPAWPEIEATDDGLVIWGAGSNLIDVEIEGVAQKSGSRLFAAPDMDGMSPRDLVGILFGSFPEAAPGGQPVPPRRKWHDRLKRLCGFR